MSLNPRLLSGYSWLFLRGLPEREPGQREGIDARRVEPCAPVQVGACRPAGGAHLSDRLSFDDRFSLFHQDL